MRVGRAICLSVLLTMLACLALWGDEVTEFRIPIRDQYNRIFSLRQYVEKQFTADNRDEEVLERIRSGLCHEADAYNQLLTDFRNATTRHGLDEEFLLLGESMLALGEITSMYSILDGEASLPAPVTERERSAIRDRVFQELGAYAGEKLDEALKTQGLADILLAGSFAEARDEAVAQMRFHVEEKIADEMERLVGLRFYNGASLGEALRQKARSLVERGVAKLLVKVTSNHLIISVATTVLLRWIGPKLQEALREKGNHEFRVERSAKTLRAARDRLNALPGDSDLGEVARALEGAARAINATHYLQSDLKRASKWALLTDITDPIGELQHTIRRTNFRFLLDKPAYTEFYDEAEGFIREIRALARCTGEEVADEPPEPGPAATQFNPPVYLLHSYEMRESIMKEFHPYDEWFLWNRRPGDDNYVTAGAAGLAPGYRIDKVRGPFTNSDQLCTELQGLGLSKVKFPGGRDFHCGPE